MRINLEWPETSVIAVRSTDSTTLVVDNNTMSALASLFGNLEKYDGDVASNYYENLLDFRKNVFGY